MSLNLPVQKAAKSVVSYTHKPAKSSLFPAFHILFFPAQCAAKLSTGRTNGKKVSVF